MYFPLSTNAAVFRPALLFPAVIAVYFRRMSHYI